MLANRSIPRCTVIPELGYPDVGDAIKWLCDAFQFTVRVRIGNHRAQLNVSEGAVVLTEFSKQKLPGDVAHSLLVRVSDVDSYYSRAQKHGAKLLRAPADHPYGERQCTVADFAGHVWTFSQTIADVAPEEWGGETGKL